MTYPIRPSAVLFCASHEGMRNFYVNAIGLKLREVHDDHSVLEADGLDVVIHPLPAHVLGPPDPAKPIPRRQNVAIKLMFPVDSIAQARLRAADAGGMIDASDAEWIWNGLRCCMGQDSEGNVFEVIERP